MKTQRTTTIRYFGFEIRSTPEGGWTVHDGFGLVGTARTIIEASAKVDVLTTRILNGDRAPRAYLWDPAFADEVLR